MGRCHKPYPIELRERAVAAYEAGDGTYQEVAASFGVAPRSLDASVARLRAEGTVGPRPPGGGWTPPVDREVLEGILREHVDATSHEISVAYNRRVEKSMRVHRSSVLRALHRIGYVVKNASAGRSRADGTSLKNGPSS